MSALTLINWQKNVPELEEWDPDRATQVEKFQNVFAYGVEESKNEDKANKKKILEIFGKAKMYKKNLMAVNHTEAVNLKPQQEGGPESLNKQRIRSIEKSNNNFCDFFLRNLHNLVWKDYDKGVLSTIPLDEALDMLKKASLALYDLLIASVDDKYNKDLTIAEMKNVIDLHNLNTEFTLNKNLKNKKK